MNPVTNTPDAVLAETAEPVDALDALLRQIVGGYFVLTDGQGAVSKWSEPAELLFAQPSEEILGQDFFGTLIGDALPPEGHAWRGFLATGEPPFFGVRRNTVTTFAADLGIPVVEGRVSRDQLYLADEVFVCGTAAEIVGICEVDGRRVGTGETGPLTRRLQQMYADAVHGRHPRSPEWLEYVGVAAAKSV